MSARVQGKNVTLLIHSESFLLPIPLGEIDKFSAKSMTYTQKTRPVGAILQGQTDIYSGYELSFEVGKVNWRLARMLHIQDQKLRSGLLPVKFFISETIDHYDGSKEQWYYKNVHLYNYDINHDSSDSMQTLQGWSSHKEIGTIDDQLFHDPITFAMLEALSLYGNADTPLSGALNFNRPF